MHNCQRMSIPSHKQRDDVGLNKFMFGMVICEHFEDKSRINLGLIFVVLASIYIGKIT